MTAESPSQAAENYDYNPIMTVLALRPRLLRLLLPLLVMAFTAISGNALAGPKPASGQFLTAATLIGAKPLQNATSHQAVWKIAPKPTAECCVAAEGAAGGGEAVANDALVSHMNEMNICAGTDCSEIAESIQRAAGGSGSILQVTPAAGQSLSLIEYGSVEDGFIYHDFFTDGSFAYDPRFSSSAVPLSDYLSGIEGLNPGSTILPR